jgi:broad specificity phosphatase PhoE
MKKLILACMVTLAACCLYAQTTTVILLRHAEKDTSTAGSASMQANPPLSKAGEARALQLVEVLGKYHPDMIYSTNYARTKATVAPLAAKYGKEIQLYAPRKLQAFADELLAMQGKTIIVAGHSNTSPALANLLIKEKKYPDLDESIYNRYWVITVKDGKAEARTEEY